jgi:hypothetical protein
MITSSYVYIRLVLLTPRAVKIQCSHCVSAVLPTVTNPFSHSVIVIESSTPMLPCLYCSLLAFSFPNTCFFVIESQRKPLFPCVFVCILHAPSLFYANFAFSSHSIATVSPPSLVLVIFKWPCHVFVLSMCGV